MDGREALAAEAGAPASDGDLILRAQAGDRQAFGELVTRYMRRAYYAALGLLGAHDDALDVSQEAFVRAYRARDRLDPTRPFYPWLYQILRRLCFNHTRDRRARTDALDAATPWLVAQASATAADPARETERAELRRRIEAAVESLPPHEREVFVLREFEGLRYREIAELVEIPIGTVMSRLYTARRHLADRLGDLS